MSNLEQTLSIIKPDAVERNLIEEIKQEFKKNNFTILKEKKIKLEKQEAEKFYKVHQTKPFYNDLCSYLSSGPIAKPDEIKFTDSLPKTRSGKIMRRILRALASGDEISGDTSTLEDRSVLDKLRS